MEDKTSSKLKSMLDSKKIRNMTKLSNNHFGNYTILINLLSIAKINSTKIV